MSMSENMENKEVTSTTGERNFYVYAILDHRKQGVFQYRDSRIFDCEPYYIGKGKEYRCFEHLGQLKSAKKVSTRLYNKMRKIFRETGEEPIIVKLYENLSEEQALETEIFLIKQIGRCDQKRGPLTNATDGGEGLSGHKHLEETKQKISIAQLGEKNHTYGKIGINNPRFGLKHSIESKRRMAEIRKLSKHTEETKQKMSEIHSGEKNKMYGKHHTEESRKKMSKKRKQYWEQWSKQNKEDDVKQLKINL